jgi:predicted transposase/invertase (TIGR01784 family)
MYDNICKVLAATFPTDFATWLLGRPVPLTKLEPTELLSEPIRADSVIFLESSEIILHIEFQTDTDPKIPVRMINYCLRLHSKFPNRQIHQVVIYLKRTTSQLAYETEFNLPNTRHKFNVIRLWEQPTEIFERYLGLLPFAPLSNTDDPEETLKQVANQIKNISDQNLQSHISASTYITSGLVLNKEIIDRLLRSEIMKESVTYQAILEEGEAKGKAEGEVQAIRQVAINMINSGLEIDLIAKITGLTVAEVANLTKAQL